MEKILTSIKFLTTPIYIYKNTHFKKGLVNKKSWKKSFRTHFILNTHYKIKYMASQEIKSKRILKSNLKYKLSNLIESSFLDYNTNNLQVIKPNSPTNFITSNVYKNIYKELTLNQLNKDRQFFFVLKDFITNIYNDASHNYLFDNVIRNQIINQPNTKFFNKVTCEHYLYNQIYLKQIIYGLVTKTFKYNLNIEINNLALSCLHPVLANIALNYNINNKTYLIDKLISKKTLDNLFLNSNLSLKQWVFTNLSLNYADEIKFINWKPLSIDNYKNFMRKKRFISFIKGRQIINNNFIAHYRLNKTKENSNVIKRLIWKNNNSRAANYFNKKHLTKDFYLFARNKSYPIIIKSKQHKIWKSISKALVLRDNHRAPIAKNLFYLLLRLEEKIDILKQNPKSIDLLKLYNLIKLLIISKYRRKNLSAAVLSNKQNIIRGNKMGWKNIMYTLRNKAFSKKDKDYSLFTHKVFTLVRDLKKNNLNSVKNPRSRSVPVKFKNALRLSIHVKRKNIKNFKPRKKLNIRQKFTEKLTLTNNYNKITENKNALSLLINKQINFFFINALALTKYAFNLQRHFNQKQKQSASKYIQKIDRDLINKYKYVAIYIKDLIRICFIGMFLKKPTFITRFIAFQLSKLPRNRKETQFIKFIIKVVKTFAAEREEIGGLRIKFKGRVNRWRRTKSIIGERGSIQLQTIDSHIEYGSAHAINRKGALGIGLWVRYLPGYIYCPTPAIKFSYSYLAKESLLRYIKYSQYKAKVTKKNKYLNIKQKLKRLKVYFNPETIKHKIKSFKKFNKNINKSDFRGKNILKKNEFKGKSNLKKKYFNQKKTIIKDN